MIDFGGQIYYIDIEAFDKLVTITPKKTDDGTISSTETKNKYDGNGVLSGTEITVITAERAKEIDSTKYELLRTCLEVLIDYDEESDDSLGSDRFLAKTPLAFKIAFNTLYNYGILKDKE